MKGRITDVSMGGMAVTFSKAELLDMKEGDVFLRTHIYLETRNLMGDIKLMKKSEIRAAFSFEKMSDQFQEVLADYLYFKISQYMKNK